MKLQKKLVKLKETSRGISRIPTISGTEMFPTLVHGRKPLNNVTKGALMQGCIALKGVFTLCLIHKIT